MRSQGITDLATIGRSNDILPELMQDGLRDLITLAERELTSFEEKIQCSIIAYEDLVSQHGVKLAQLTRYRFAAAPHKKLPPEILSEIFLLCIEGPAILLPKHTNAPWNLCHVCSRWRAVALDTAALWRDLHADFSSLAEFKYPRLVHLTFNCFSWARNSKISLRISGPKTPCQEELRILLLELIVRNASQFKHISIDHTESLTPLLWNRHVSFDSLKSVCLTFTTPDFLDFPDTRYLAVSMFRQASSFQSFTLTAQKDLFNECIFPLPWNQLVELWLVDVILPSRNGHQILRQCTNLVSCCFSLTADVPNGVQFPGDNTPTLLAKLISLKITAEHPGSYGEFLVRFILPALSDLEIVSRRDARWIDSELTSLLNRSRCSLQRLSAEFISGSNILTLLERNPELRQLSLLEDYLPPMVLTQMTSYELVPKLESLSCAAYFLGDFTALLDSRWLASHTSGCTAITKAILICGKNYRHRFSKDAWLLVNQLRLEGMDITVKNRSGDLLFYDGDDRDD